MCVCVYLIKVRVVSLFNPGPVSLSTSIHLNHRFDVVARKLSTLDHLNPNLDITEFREPKKRNF